MRQTLPSTTASAHNDYIKRETLKGIVINCVLSVTFTVLFIPKAPFIGLWGPGGMAMDLVPTVFMLTLMGNLAVTLISTKRLRSGAINAIPSQVCGWCARHLPSNPFLRVMLVAVVMTILVVPASVLLLWLLDIDSMSYTSYLVFKAIFGPLVGVLSIGVVLRAALMQRE